MSAIFFLNSCFNHEQRATVISGRNWGFRWSTIGTYRGWLSSSFKDLTNLTSSCLNTTMFSCLMHVNIYDKCWSALAPVCISGITGLTFFPVLSHMSVLQWFDSLPDVSISFRKSPLDHCLHIVKFGWEITVVNRMLAWSEQSECFTLKQKLPHLNDSLRMPYFQPKKEPSYLRARGECGPAASSSRASKTTIHMRTKGQIMAVKSFLPTP